MNGRYSQSTFSPSYILDTLEKWILQIITSLQQNYWWHHKFKKVKMSKYTDKSATYE